jgi:hypothetical protein
LNGVRGWLLAGLIAVLIAAAAYIAQPRPDSPEHNSGSDAPNGTSAALLFAGAMGHPADQIAGAFSPPGPTGLMFVFTPTSGFSTDEARQTLNWVHGGGTLVYASETGDAELDAALEVTRLRSVAPVSQELGNPILDGVSQVAGATFVFPLVPSTDQVPALRTQGGQVTAYVQHVGSGTAFVLSDPLVLCNGYLDKQDNGRLLADLLGLAPASAPVGFDEYHHGLVLNDLRLQAWVTTPWGAALLWLLIAVFIGLVLRNRAFGPRIPRPPDVARSDVEWTAAVGQMLRRSGARQTALGLPLQPRERFWNALRVRAPVVAAELAQAEVDLNASAASEKELVSAASRLHRIAYPVSEGRRGSPDKKESS